MKTRYLFVILIVVMFLFNANCQNNPTNPISDGFTPTSIEVSPSITAVVKGNTQQFSAIAPESQNPLRNVVWELSGSVNGSSINQSGLLTVTRNETARSLEVICTSVAASSISNTSTVYVADIETPGVFIYYKRDANANVVSGLHTIVKWSDNHLCNWELFGGVEGTYLSPYGELIPGDGETYENIRLRATSIENSSKWGEVNIEGVTEHFPLQYRDDDDIVVPLTRTRLRGNYPNPFNYRPSTTITFDLATDGAVSLVVYNMNGQTVQTLVDDVFVIGRHRVVWNGADDDGMGVDDGVYYVRMLADGYEGCISMVLSTYIF